MHGTVTLTSGRLAAVVLAALLVGGGSGVLATTTFGPPSAPTVGSPDDDSESGSIEAFESAADFREYLRAGRRAGGVGHWRAGRDLTVRTTGATLEAQAAGDQGAGERADVPRATAAPTGGSASGAGGAAGVPDRRASSTNVQVGGIDEPDVLKTTADTLYYATRGRVRYHPEPARLRDDPAADGRPASTAGVHLLDASDPAAPAVASRINVSGRLLLAGDTLVVLAGDRLLGYDVTDRSDPERTWSKSLEGRVVAARLHGGHVYVVSEQRVDRDQPCPVRPMAEVSVPCTGLHHPTRPVPVESTYAVTVLNPGDGSVDDTAGFVGTAGRSVVYMSAGSVYVTYAEPSDRTELLFEFFLSEQSDRLDEATLDRLREIRGYDLSQRAKRYELQATVRRWLAGLNESERREARTAVQSDRREWAREHKREFERTGIAEFEVRGAETDAPSIEPGATGTVPGRPLDQFALDEHEGHLRVATTVDGVYGTDSANDVYVLDDSLDVVGAVTDMGLTERIYSVRFRGDEAYVVTFRRIDPFHVLDLSEPTEPALEGELKLPGYSSYLHPLGEDRVLGIGEEDGRVKLVVFDVADPADPTIEHSRVLDARWSAVANSHHAFLLDPRHEVFFLPAGDAGQVYSYDGGITHVTSVSVDGNARRAAYVGDYLYVFGDRSATVVDETTWEELDTLALT